MPASLPPSFQKSTPFLGQVATRCYVANQTIAPATATWASGRTMHWARARIVSPTIVFPMWSVTAGNVESLTAGGTVKAAIELTLGTRAAQNAEGAVSFTSGYAVCTFPGVTIPAGTRFWVDHLVVNTNGLVYSGFPGQSMNSTEGWTFSTGTPTDYTVSGTPPAPFLYSMGYGPILILGQTTQPSVLMTGTSRSYGIYDFSTDVLNDRGPIARLIGRRFGYTDISLASSTLNTFNAQSKTYRNQITGGTISGIATGVPYHTHIVNEYGINDLNGGDTAAALVTRRSTFAASYPAHVVIGTTLTPNPSSTDNFATTTNQTLGSGSTKIATFNDLVRGGISGERFVFDTSDIVDPYRSGKWPVSRNPNDTSSATASFTGVISGNTLTVSALTGTIVRGATLFGTNVIAATQIMPFGTNSTTGTGGTGTYYVNQNGTVASTAMTTGGLGSADGLHETSALCEMIRDRGAWMADLIS